MTSKSCMIVGILSVLFAVAATVRAAAGDPPPSSLDLGAAKPKPNAGSVPSPSSILPIGQSPMSRQRSATDTGAAGTSGTQAVGTAIKSPLGNKGVLGSPVSSGISPQSTADDTASSSDVVVKMPSNMKK